MKTLFLGKALHWAVVVAIIALLYLLGANQYHRVDYPAFLFAMLGIAAAAIVVMIATTRRGDRVTREPLDEEDAGG